MENSALQWGELRLEEVDVVAVDGEDVAFDVREEAQDLVGGGPPGAAVEGGGGADQGPRTSVMLTARRRE